MSPQIFTPEAHANSSKIISEYRRKRRNIPSNEKGIKRKYYISRKKGENQYLVEGSVVESQGYHRHHKEISTLLPKNPTVDLTATFISDPVPVDNTDDENKL